MWRPYGGDYPEFSRRRAPCANRQRTKGEAGGGERGEGEKVAKRASLCAEASWSVCLISAGFALLMSRMRFMRTRAEGTAAAEGPP